MPECDGGTGGQNDGETGEFANIVSRFACISILTCDKICTLSGPVYTDTNYWRE